MDGSDYHFNVPANMGLSGFPYVIVPGHGDRLVVAQLVGLIPSNEYPNATEWVVAGAGHQSLVKYFGAEKQAFTDAKARRELVEKRKKLQGVNAKIRTSQEELNSIFGEIGEAVVRFGGPIALTTHLTKARGLTTELNYLAGKREVIMLDIATREAAL